MEYKPTIGLEIHAELKTKTKMFCDCKNDTDETHPNVNICPICMGHPGTLPVINKEAVKHVLKVGLALDVPGETADFSEFDRKNYFYPDIPKGYQISQYKYPLISGGELSQVKLTRIHLEEDTAKSTHDQGDYSLVDFNRAGVPLMELVTEPVIHSSEEAVGFAKELQLLLQYIDVANANMEKGEMRVEANISVSKTESFGTKVEVKNLNSFSAVERAIEYEVKRQIEVLENGEKVVQETRGWDEVKQRTFSQRSKEDSHDYRYFPDPDLPKLKLSELPDFDKSALVSQVKETPLKKRNRFKDQYHIKDSDIEVYIKDRDFAGLFEESAKILEFKNNNGFKEGFYQTLSNFIVNDLVGLGNKSLSVNKEQFVEVVYMYQSNTINSRIAKDTIKILVESGGKADVIMSDLGFKKVSQEDILDIVKDLLRDNEEVVLEYKNGKTSALQFLVGQGMKLSKGSANPQVLKEALEKMLN